MYICRQIKFVTHTRHTMGGRVVMTLPHPFRIVSEIMSLQNTNRKRYDNLQSQNNSPSHILASILVFSTSYLIRSLISFLQCTSSTKRTTATSTSTGAILAFLSWCWKIIGHQFINLKPTSLYLFKIKYLNYYSRDTNSGRLYRIELS